MAALSCGSVVGPMLSSFAKWKFGGSTIGFQWAGTAFALLTTGLCPGFFFVDSLLTRDCPFLGLFLILLVFRLLCVGGSLKQSVHLRNDDERFSQEEVERYRSSSISRNQSLSNLLDDSHLASLNSSSDYSSIPYSSTGSLDNRNSGFSRRTSNHGGSVTDGHGSQHGSHSRLLNAASGMKRSR